MDFGAVALECCPLRSAVVGRWRLIMTTKTAGIGLLVLISIARQGVGEEWRDRLEKEAPDKWSALEAYYAHFEASWNESVTKNYGDKKEQRTRKRLLINGDNVRLEITKGMRTGVVAANKKYLFNVRRQDETMPYLLNYYGKQNEFNLINEFRLYTQALCYCQNVPLSRWGSDACLGTTSVDSVEVGGKRMVRWRSRYTPGEKETGKGTENEGIIWNIVPTFDAPFDLTLVLDPDSYWCIKSYEMNVFTINLIYSGSNEYQRDERGFPVVRRVRRDERGADNRVKTIICDFEIAESKDIPESMFTLSAFGLSEMESETIGWWERNRIWLGLVSVLVLLGLVAIVVRLVRKRFIAKTA
jgi:hypothetical protein